MISLLFVLSSLVQNFCTTLPCWSNASLQHATAALLYATSLQHFCALLLHNTLHYGFNNLWSSQHFCATLLCKTHLDTEVVLLRESTEKKFGIRYARALLLGRSGKSECLTFSGKTTFPFRATPSIHVFTLSPELIPTCPHLSTLVHTCPLNRSRRFCRSLVQSLSMPCLHSAAAEIEMLIHWSPADWTNRLLCLGLPKWWETEGRWGFAKSLEGSDCGWTCFVVFCALCTKELLLVARKSIRK